MANLSLDHGNSDASCLAYVWLGMLLGPRFGDYRMGYRFGKLGFDLLESRGILRFKARVYNGFGHRVNPWARHLSAGFELLRRGFQAAQETGDITYAVYNKNCLITLLLAGGEPLEEVQREAENALEFVRNARFGLVVDIAPQTQLFGQVTTALNWFVDNFPRIADWRSHVERVVALDLNLPDVAHPRVDCVQGNAAQLGYPDRSFHTVVCAEVLEHIPPAQLPRVCRELVRVADRHVVIGVPFKQDLRVDACTCRTCGAVNPPWGHVNSFDLERLVRLMDGLVPARVDYVGRTRSVTNAVSAALQRYAGNPYGTYEQDEPCIQCGQRLLPPAERNFTQKVATKLAHWGTTLQMAATPWRANWIHVLFERPPR